MKHILLTLFISLLPFLSLRAQTFKAQIEDVGGYYRLSYTVSSTDAEGFTPPSLAAFEVLSGPASSTYSSYTIVNGKASHTASTTYTYIVSPKKSGRVTIGPATVRVGNRTLRSNALTLQAQASDLSAGGSQGSGVRPAGHQSGGADAMDEVQQAGSPVTQRDLFIDVTPSRTRVREQEAVLLTYRIHARAGVALQGTSLAQKPDFKGLISQEIPLPGNQIQTTTERRNGTTYRTGTILQYVVYPQQSGKLTIPSITFSTTVLQQDHHIDIADAFFNGGGTIGVSVKRTVAPLTLQVDALPEPRPADFSGAVGRFTMRGELLNKTVRTNDAATYRITIEGTGNLKLITAPKIAFPKDFDTFDAKSNEQSRLTAQGQAGKITFDYTFIPQNVGDYTLPAVTVSYFDTESGRYRTLSTEAVRLHVEKGNLSKSQSDRALRLLHSDIRPLHPTVQSPLVEWGSGFYWLLLLAVVVVGCLAVAATAAYVRGRADVAGRRTRSALKRSLRVMAEARAADTGADRAEFYTAVSRALTGYLCDVTGLGQSEMDDNAIRRLLAGAGVGDEQIRSYLDLLETCRYAAYAPGAANDREAVYSRAVTLLTALDKQMRH